jgi:hypothetical protein
MRVHPPHNRSVRHYGCVRCFLTRPACKRVGEEKLCGPKHRTSNRWVSQHLPVEFDGCPRTFRLEDHCTGKFWEGRFKSQALLDEAGVLTAMVYVDLSPIRAGVAATPEESEYTSIYQRIRELREANEQRADVGARVPLRPFQSPGGEHSMPYRFDHYLQRVDLTGRAVRIGWKTISSSPTGPAGEYARTSAARSMINCSRFWFA